MLENKKFMEYFISALIQQRIEKQRKQRGKNGMGRPSKSCASAGAGRCNVKKDVKVQKAQKSNGARKSRSNKVSKGDTILRRMARILVPMQWNGRKFGQGDRPKTKRRK